MTLQQPTALAGRRLIAAGEYRRVVGGISEMTRWRHEKAGIGPMPIRLNGRVYYFQDEVLAYLDQLAATRHRDGDDEASREESDDPEERSTAE